MRTNDTSPRVPRRGPASGRFVLRLDPDLHRRLREEARDRGLSLNAYCAERLASRSAASSPEEAPEAVVRQALALFGRDLVGVVAYGSWARGEATAGSDVDILVVLDTRVPLSRNLYRRWDEIPVTWEDRRVETHFAHLPDPARVVGGLWGEVALDGIVLLDPSFRLSTMLVRVRHDIVDGKIVRRTSHGQPYWVPGEVA